MLYHFHIEEISMLLLIPRPEVELRGKIMIPDVSTTLQVARIPYILNYFSSILGGSHLLTVA